MLLTDVVAAYENDLAIVESLLEKEQDSYVSLIPEISRHIIMSGGKRIRPLLLMIASDLFQYRGEARYSLAAVMEFIHTASLLHDDVIDHANIRRGRAAANQLWGNAASVLVGDYLYATAFRLLAEADNGAVHRMVAAAATTMVEGETIQLVKSGDVTITEEEYLSVIEKKTAVLMAVSCALGAVLADAPASSVDRLNRFGMKLGLAFQLTDDTLDYVGVEEDFGKTIGMDVKEGKMTLPLIWSLSQSTPEEGDRIRTIVAARSAGEADIRDVVSFIRSRGGVEYALERAAGFVDEAKRLLDPLPESFAREALTILSDHVLTRTL